jgi:hypothetical protein
MKETILLFLILIATAGCRCAAPPEPPPPDGPPVSFMDKYDASRDGRVSTDEFDGRIRVFVELDRNRDSYITPDEAPESLPPISLR